MVTDKNYELTFAKEIIDGLKSSPKELSSKYLYDQSGDRLFQQLTEQPDYYLYRSEYEIIENHTKELVDLFFEDTKSIDLIDLGSGDGKKTRLFLSHLHQNDYDFVYRPVDISKTVLEEQKETLNAEFPGMRIEPRSGEYFEVLKQLNTESKRRKVLLVLGSNIGNLDHQSAIEFLSGINSALKSGDLLFIGFDRRKSPQKIWEAYNDKGGITTAFVKNILKRLNKELGADFETDKFLHWTDYDPVTGILNNNLVASEKMEVKIKKLNTTVFFEQWEPVRIAVSKKYSEQEILDLSESAGLKAIEKFEDRSLFFSNYIFKKKIS